MQIMITKETLDGLLCLLFTKDSQLYFAKAIDNIVGKGYNIVRFSTQAL